MNVLVDTTIWSLALRRRRDRLSAAEVILVAEWEELIAENRAMLLGLVRQEVLSGVADEERFRRLRATLRAFDDIPVTTAEHEQAAVAFNRCRAGGVQGSPVDMLICAVARRHDFAIFTTDGDFTEYSRHLPIKLHLVRDGLR